MKMEHFCGTLNLLLELTQDRSSDDYPDDTMTPMADGFALFRRCSVPMITFPLRVL